MERIYHKIARASSRKRGKFVTWSKNLFQVTKRKTNTKRWRYYFQPVHDQSQPHQSRNSLNAKSGRDSRILVNIHLGKTELPLILVAQALKDRSNGTAGTTPGCPEIDNNRCPRLEHFGLKILIANMKQVGLCTHNSFHSLSKQQDISVLSIRSDFCFHSREQNRWNFYSGPFASAPSLSCVYHCLVTIITGKNHKQL
jgi:hypothetical protein